MATAVLIWLVFDTAMSAASSEFPQPRTDAFDEERSVGT
jgi:hypothetical protein